MLTATLLERGPFFHHFINLHLPLCPTPTSKFNSPTPQVEGSILPPAIQIGVGLVGGPLLFLFRAHCWAFALDGMVMEGASPEEARKRFYVCSSVGLLGAPNGPYGDKNLKRDMSADRVPWLRKAQLTPPFNWPTVSFRFMIDFIYYSLCIIFFVLSF